MTRQRALLVGLLALLATAGVALAAWQAHAAVRRAEGHVLLAETAVAARLLREPGGEALTARLIGRRWRRTPEIDPALGEPVLEPRDGRLAARAAVLDADGWDTVGQVTLVDDPARRAVWPGTFWLACALSAAAVPLLAVAVVGVAQRRGRGSLIWPAATWLVLGGALTAAPVVTVAHWSARSLADLTSRRLALAYDVLAGRSDLVALAAQPSGILDLTGLRFVLTAGGDSAAARGLSGFPPDVLAALTGAPASPEGRVTVDRVTYAARDVGAVRLVMLPFEHTEGRRSSMAAVGLAGVAAGLPLLVLAAALGDRRRLRREVVAWSFLAPGVLHLLVFTVGPLLYAAWLSLHRYSLVDPARPFVGTANYTALAGNGAFWNALRNTAVFTLHVPVSMAIALALAMLVRRPGRASSVARAAFFLPSITSLVAVAMVWQWILHDEYGLANAALALVGLPAVRWLSSPSVALISVMIVATWTSLGFQTVLLQAGLTAIPRELYDAARIDGASAWRRFLHVTLPGLRPTLFFVLVTSVIGSFQVFGTVYVMTEGGPLHATDVAVFHIYEEAWELQRIGSAAAMSWVLFVVIFAVTWLHFRTLERRSA